ncbi:FIGfam010717 [hydrothermal vent metagenome]|uniref:FIGfam010717 n=1 Tax=hydrothermal vent metagenome TaxID=652676 RepID=A0A3B0Y1E0_9ZZZZ
MKDQSILKLLLMHPKFSIISALFVICTTIVLADNLLLTEQQITHIQKQYGKAAAKRIRSWRVMVDAAKNLSEKDKLTTVNRFFNKIRFISDRKHWKIEDYWATPAEFMISNGGDCEDFSIAKYFTLRTLGIKSEKLRLIYVKALSLNQAHMILAYYPTPGSEPLILDNLVKKIKRGSQRKDLVPVYSFNGDYLWLSKQIKGRGEMIGSATRISLWNKVRRRMRKEQQRYSSKR